MGEHGVRSMGVQAAGLEATHQCTLTKTLLRVSGMTCSGCTLAVEQALGGVYGVHSVAVSLTQSTAKVMHAGGVVSPGALVNAASNAGFEASIFDEDGGETIVLQVGGLVGTSDIDTIRHRMSELQRVTNLSFDLLCSNVKVHYDTLVLGPRDILTAIQELGYTVQLAEEAANTLSEGAAVRQKEIRFWRRKFWAGFVLSVPIVLLTMVFQMIPATEKGLEASLQGFTAGELAKWALSTPVLFYVGWTFHAKAYLALKRGRATMDVLVSAGSLASYTYSIFSMVHRYQQFQKGLDAYGRDYFETAALLITFISLGKLLEAIAKGKASEAVSELLSLSPSNALLLTQDAFGNTQTETQIPSALVHRGDLLKVMPGTRMPADGLVYHGHGFVDESMITGESRPVAKKPGSEVVGGSVNGGSSIIIQATRIGRETTLRQIVRLVEGAQLSKPLIQAFADRMSAYFVPFVVVGALVTWASWFAAGKASTFPVEWYPPGSNAFLFALLFSISTVVIACPCALGLATPTAVMVASGIAASHGILVKGGPALEAARNVQLVAFDKTGTLTVGKPSVTDIKIFASTITTEEVLYLAAAAEANSEHPIAQAIVRYSHQSLFPDSFLDLGGVENAEQARPQDRSWIRQLQGVAETLPGKGVRAWVSSQDRSTKASTVKSEGPNYCRVLIGNRRLFAEEGMQMPADVATYMRQKELKGATVVILAAGDLQAAAFTIEDPIRSEARAVICALQSRGIKCCVLSGDNWTTTRIVSYSVGIDHVMAEVLPAAKASKIKELKDIHSGAVAMVGDGINDSPALAQADVGFAIGSGTDIAIETADFVLIKSNLADVLTALDLARKTYQRILFNYFWALLYNVAMMPLAAGAFYAPLRWQLPPWAAGGAMALSSVSVVCSSLLLKNYKPPM